MEEKSISLVGYRWFLIFLKYGSFLIGIVSFITVMLGCFGITTPILSILFQISLVPTIMWLFASFTFRCCIWHRLPLYYTWVNNVISWIDYTWTIPINNLQMIFVYSTITIVFILIGMYFKNKYNVKTRTT